MPAAPTATTSGIDHSSQGRREPSGSLLRALCVGDEALLGSGLLLGLPLGLLVGDAEADGLTEALALGLAEALGAGLVDVEGDGAEVTSGADAPPSGRIRASRMRGRAICSTEERRPSLLSRIRPVSLIESPSP